MRFTSHLPQDLGNIGNEWRRELGAGNFANINADVDLVIPQAEGNIEVDTRDSGPAIEELPGIQATLAYTDAHFRQTYAVPKNFTTLHLLTVRTGPGNATAVPDMAYAAIARKPKVRLLRSMVHMNPFQNSKPLELI